MFEPENIMVVGSFWHNHYDDDYWDEGEDERIRLCDIYKCSECPRKGDDCDGDGEEYEDDDE